MRQYQEIGLSFIAVDQYLRYVQHIPPLSEEEEAHLLRCLAVGVDVQQARDRLVEGYQHLVVKLARRFARNCRHLELLDFAQEGSIGLLRAIEKYEIGKAGVSFQTLAFSWARGSMLMAYWQYERTISIPFSKIRSLRQMNVVRTRLFALFHREPTIAEIAQEMSFKERDVEGLMVLQDLHMVSLHLPLEDEETLLEDVLEDTKASAFIDEERSSIEEVLGTLAEREQLVIRLRYGLVDERAYTQKEVADRLGVASSRVAVLERRAILRLRKALEH